MAMDIDLETFLTALYVIVNDVYQTHIRPQMPVCGGPSALMSDSEVLCLGLAAQWRSGVPWKSERGIMRYGHKHRRPLFPTRLTQRAFHRRLRRLWGAFILIPDAVAAALTDAADSDVMDGFPIPVAHGARSFPPGWLADIARIGKGGKARYFYGVRVAALSSASICSSSRLMAWKPYVPRLVEKLYPSYSRHLRGFPGTQLADLKELGSGKKTDFSSKLRLREF
jgi:hypothetical protein